MGSDSEILSLFDEWNAALQTGDPERVAGLYAAEAILQPTVSNKVRHTYAEIRDYFVHLVGMVPKGVIDEANVRVCARPRHQLGALYLHLRRRQQDARTLHVRVSPLRGPMADHRASLVADARVVPSS